MTEYRCCFLLWLLCVCIGLVVGCDRKERCDDGAVARMVQNLPVRPAGDHVMLYTSVSQTCNEIAKLKDASSKPGQYKALAARLTDIDLASLDGNDRVLIFGDYRRSLDLVCAKMADGGLLDRETFTMVLKGWKKCREMCNLPDEGEAGTNARKLRAMFENDAALFERDVLRLILKSRNISKERQAEYYAMWHEAFGCRVKSHPEYRGGRIATDL